MSDFDDDEDDAKHEEMLRKHRQRLQEAAKKYSVELDNKSELKPSPPEQTTKYDNPFERSGEEFDREMFESTEGTQFILILIDFITDSLNPKSKVKIHPKPKANEEAKQKHSELASIYEDKRSKESTELQKSHILVKSEYNDWDDNTQNFDKRSISLNEEDELLKKKVAEIWNGSFSSNSDLDRYNHDDKPVAEQSYQDILKKYTKLDEEEKRW